MQILMEKTELVILCEAGRTDECRTFAQVLRQLVASLMGATSVLVMDSWNEGAHETSALFSVIDTAKTIVSIFAPQNKPVSPPHQAVWKSVDEYAWYHTLTYQGPANSKPRYIPVIIQEATGRPLVAHLKTMRLGRVPPNWLSIISQNALWQNRTMTENLKAILKVLNVALSLSIDLTDFVRVSEQVLRQGPSLMSLAPPCEKMPHLVPPPSVNNQQRQGEPVSTSTAVPNISYSMESESHSCTLTVACMELKNFSVCREPSQTVVSMKMTI